jgi:hypothetical protein
MTGTSKEKGWEGGREEAETNKDGNSFPPDISVSMENYNT